MLDLRHDLQLDFLEAVFGCSREIDVDRLAGCSVSLKLYLLDVKVICIPIRRLLSLHPDRRLVMEAV